jgi:hypothetical protein
MHCKKYNCPDLSRIFIHIFKLHRTSKTRAGTRNAELCVAHTLLYNSFVAYVLWKCVPGDYAKLAPAICCCETRFCQFSRGLGMAEARKLVIELLCTLCPSTFSQVSEFLCYCNTKAAMRSHVLVLRLRVCFH